MTYYDTKTIEQVKRFSLVDILRRDGLTLKKQGKDYFTCCPFHDDKTPSFSVTPDKNLWHCLGACQMGGSPIDYVMKRDGVSFKKAVETLLSEQGETPAQTVQPSSESTAKASSISRTSPEAQSLLHDAVELYHQNLLQSEAALAYLTQRGLNHPVLISTFRLGYAQKNVSRLLPGRNSEAGKQARLLAKNIGLTASSGIERYAGSLVVPVVEQANGHQDNGPQPHIVELYGRKISSANKLRPGTPLHQYLPGKHQGIWNLSGLEGEMVILCEALIDAMSFWVQGMTSVTCSYGVNGLSPSFLAVLAERGIKRILIAYDNDEAGNRAAQCVADDVLELGITPWRVQLPKDKDVNAFMVASTQPKQDMEALLRQASAMASSTDKHAILPASPAQETVPVTVDVQDINAKDSDIHITLANRRYRVRGLPSTPAQQMKINLRLTLDSLLYLDTLDMYHARQRQQFIAQASVECGVSEVTLKQDLCRVLLILEAQQVQEKPARDNAVQMSETDKADALSLLQSPDLLDVIVDDFTRCGVVGEQSNTLVGYLACVSRKLDKPLALIIQSSSAAGKSALMDAILHMCPDEDVTQFSAMTGQSLFYMEGASLKHRILAISEEEGASQAAYALKLLQSQGCLTMASTGKDPVTGQLVTQEYEVEGPHHAVSDHYRH